MKGILRDLFEGFVHWALLMVALLVLVGFSAAAHAAGGTAQLTTTLPTTYVDGSALASSAITGSDIDCQFTPTGSSTATACASSPTSVTGAAATASVSITYPAATGGKACFRMRTKTASAVSDWSALGANSCKDLPALAPSAPGAVTVTITLSLNLKSDTPITVAVNQPVTTVSP